jgi:hypothetical protein
LLEIFRDGLDVLFGVEGVADVELVNGRGHELHETLGDFGQDGAGAAAGLLYYDSAQEPGVELAAWWRRSRG